jgi:hypothetical protein
MRNSNVFWAVLLILAGILFLLGNFGVLDVNVWSLLWPLFLIALGAWLVIAVLRPRPPAEMRPASIDLEGATSARVKLNHGAGELTLGAGASPTMLAEGSFGGGLDYRTNRRGDVLEARLGVPGGVIVSPFSWAPGALDWNMRLNSTIPIELECETGASKTLLDLRDLKVTAVELETGASKTDVVLPANAGYTKVKIEAGAAAVDITVPGGVAARISNQSGLSSIRIDQTRFPGSGNRFESPDYATAANKVDIQIETGVGSVTVS